MSTDRIREASVYLIAAPKSYGSLTFRTTANAPKLAADEVALQLTVKLPDAIFRRPALRANVVVPPELVSRPVIDSTVVDNVRAELQKQLGVDLTIAVVEPSGEAG